MFKEEVYSECKSFGDVSKYCEIPQVRYNVCIRTKGFFEKMNNDRNWGFIIKSDCGVSKKYKSGSANINKIYYEIMISTLSIYFIYILKS